MIEEVASALSEVEFCVLIYVVSRVRSRRGSRSVVSWVFGWKMVVEALGAKGFESVGLAGFCWGAKVAVLTGKEKSGHVKAIVQLHPGLAEESDYAEVALPISVLAAPEDGIEKFKGLLKMRKKEEHLKVYVKIFKGVMHGWTIRYDENDKKAVAKANQAHRRLLVWFHKYLH